MNKEPEAKKKFRRAVQECLSAGYLAPELAMVLVEQMERTVPLQNRVYGSVCGDKWVEISIRPWSTHKLQIGDDDVEMGQF